MLASDSICGKSTQRRMEVNKKGKNHANDLKFSKARLFTDAHDKTRNFHGITEITEKSFYI